MARDLPHKSSGDDNDGFSVLKSLRNTRLGGRVASLIGADDLDPNPEAFAQGVTNRYSAELDRDRPDPNTEDYWNEYRNNPIITTQINSFASDCWEGGWHITADSDETVGEIEEFCKNMAIRAGQPHQTISQIGKLAVTQHQVRGTFLGEKMYDDRGRPTGINPVNASTIEIYTKHGVNILAPADYKPESQDTTIKRNEAGEVAAYVQFDHRLSSWQNRKERRFTRDEMLHWAREPDIGDVFGNSRVEPVLARSRALREKLNDNDLAIAMKAWPMILFKMGHPERPWTLDRMEDFMEDYTEGELGPGMFQGVPGDIEVKEFAGETADIREPVMTDVDMIVSAMPGPKHSTGSFPGEEGVPTEAHERQYMKLVRETRLQLENLFTPYLRDVAKAWGYDPSGLRLHVGRPEGEVAPEDIQGNIIRYDGVGNSNDSEGEDDSVVPTTGSSGSSSSDSGESSDADESNDFQVINEDSTQRSTTEPLVTLLADPEYDYDGSMSAELADGLIGTNGIESDLGSLMADILIDARTGAMDVLKARHSSKSTPRADAVAREFESQVGSNSRSQRLVGGIEDVCHELKSHVLSELSGGSNTPDVNHRSLCEKTREGIISDLRRLGESMSAEIERQVDEIAETAREPAVIEERIENIYSDSAFRHRARLIAQMRLQELLNEIKRTEYAKRADVDGVTVEANCTDSTHRLTADLAGCDGEQATAWFDDDETIAEQLQAAVTADPTAEFNPMTGVPPYSFGSRAELAPIRRSTN